MRFAGDNKNLTRSCWWHAFKQSLFDVP